MIPQFPVYLFDVDGTLVDSAPDICGAVQEVLTGTRARAVDELYLRRYIGYHLFDLFHDLIPDVTEEEKQTLLTNYRSTYTARKHSATRLYPGVQEAIARIGGRKSTATTKSTATVRSVLEMFDLLPHFDHVQGTDGFPAKPAPDVIFKSLEVFGVPPDQVLMIGDAATDMAAGRAAGVKICAVSWGYGDHKAMATYEPDYWIDDLSALAG